LRHGCEWDERRLLPRSAAALALHDLVHDIDLVLDRLLAHRAVQPDEVHLREDPFPKPEGAEEEIHLVLEAEDGL
jgi:hypothetical protein